MADKMENLLAQTIIEATKVNQTDIALERMTQHAVRKNLHAQQNLVRFQEGRLSNLQNDVESLKSDIKNKNLEKRQLQDKLKIAINMYEEANDATGAWIDLLNKPLHEIAKKHQGFNSNFNEMLGNFSKIVLENMVKEEVIDFMADKLDFSPLQVEVISHNFEEIILKEQNPENQESSSKVHLIGQFHEELTEKHHVDKKKIKQKMIQSGKNYKI